MDGKVKFVLFASSSIMLCMTILFTLLLIALWQYKVIVGISLLVVLLSGTFSVCCCLAQQHTTTTSRTIVHARVEAGKDI